MRSKGCRLKRTRYHICWGSWNGPHMFDVPLKDIVDLVLEVNIGAFSFEAANPRHEHEWKIWKDVRLPPETGAHARSRRALDQRREAPASSSRSASCGSRKASAAIA